MTRPSNTRGARLPEVAALELTYRCNHRCLFCSCPWEADETYEKNELSFAEWTCAIDTLLANGVRAVTLTGGEPLLREDLRDIIDYVLSKGVPLNMISNGRAITDDFLDFLASRHVPLSISVPGLDTFFAHTGVDNIDHVMGLFEKTKARGIETTANIAVTKKNLPELYENIAYALLQGADYILLNRFLPGGRGLENEELLLNIDETNRMLEIAEDVLKTANRYGHVGTELPLCAIREPERYKHLRISSLCAAAKGFCILDPGGYLKTCNHSPTRICRYDELEQLNTHPYWRAFRERDYLPQMCRNCDKKDCCDGGCREAAHVYGGSIDAPDPLFVTP